MKKLQTTYSVFYLKERLQSYLELCKPKVVLLLLITAMVGMFLASPGWVEPFILIFATLGIGLGAASAAVVNHIVDQQFDIKMNRTLSRPIPQGKVSTKQAVIFSALLGLTSMLMLTFLINPLTAWLTLFGMVGYAFIYSMYLKHATPQNIVIGGLSGALPPLLGWTSVTNSIDREALILVLIIFTWTPPHFWALAIHRKDDYKNANIPMLPVTHGIEFTKNSIIFYCLMLFLVSLVPFIIGMNGMVYLISAMVLGSWFLYYAIKLKVAPKADTAITTFFVSIKYLFLLFLALLFDHSLLISGS